VVLIVDDEPAILDALEDLLDDDFQVLKAASGLAGLELLDNHPVSVVLSDQKMPGMKGEEFLARVAESHVTTRVLLTGYSDFDDLVRAVNRGHIYAFVSKPWSPHQLRSLVRAAAERFHLEKELLHEKRLLDLLLECIPDLISIKDPQGRYVRLNSACAQALGLEPPAEAIGKTDAELGGPLFEESESRERAVLEQGEIDADRTEKALRGPGWFSSTRVTTPSEEGWPLLIGISRDITERLESNRRLEAHAQQLERIHEELSRFSFIVAHHLQEPIRSIAGFTELLRRRSLLREGAEEYIGYIGQSARRAKSLMRDFSTYLDLRQAGPMGPVDLAVAARAALEDLAIGHPEIPLELVGQAQAWGHAELLTELFRALLENSLVHASSSERVKVALVPEETRVHVTIEDQGPGIPPDAHSRVFRLFETLETEGRSGLGLALSQKIVELHGGEIWLESPLPEGGLRVHFTLARCAADEAVA
jgi:PAS domain S-box-containing protein